MNEKLKDSLNIDPPEDLAIEKYLFFDEFLNSLHVLCILREAFWKTAHILEMEKFPEEYESMVFKSFREKRIHLVNEIDNNLALSFVLKICPFLFLSKHHLHLVEDLAKFLKKENVDGATLDEIYFAVKCF